MSVSLSEAGTVDSPNGNMAGLHPELWSLSPPSPQPSAALGTDGFLTDKQMEIGRQLETAGLTQNASELFTVQWKLIRDKLISISRDLKHSRDDVETLRSAVSRRDLKDAEVARILQQCQATVESESNARRKQESDYQRALNDFRRTMEQERLEGKRALESFNAEISGQLKSIRQQELQVVEREKSFEKRIETRFDFFMKQKNNELQGKLERGFSEVNSKFEEFERDLRAVSQGSVQLSKSHSAERAERLKLSQGINEFQEAIDKRFSELTQLKLQLQRRDDDDSRLFSEIQDEIHAIRQDLEKEAFQRGNLEKMLREGIEALQLDGTDFRSLFESLSGQTQVDYNKLQVLLQSFEVRLEEQRELTTDQFERLKLALEEVRASQRQLKDVPRDVEVVEPARVVSRSYSMTSSPMTSIAAPVAVPQVPAQVATVLPQPVTTVLVGTGQGGSMNLPVGRAGTITPSASVTSIKPVRSVTPVRSLPPAYFQGAPRAISPMNRSSTVVTERLISPTAEPRMVSPEVVERVMLPEAVVSGVTEIDRVNALGQVVERDFYNNGVDGAFEVEVAQRSPAAVTAQSMNPPNRLVSWPQR